MVRVLHLITELDVGGAEMMLYKLLCQLSTEERKYSMVVSLADVGPVGELIREQGIEVQSLGFRPGRFSLPGFKKLCGFLRQYEPDVIQTWLYHGDLIGTLAILATKKRRLLWNIRCSNMALGNYRHSLRWVIKGCSLLSKIPEAVIFNSANAMEFHKGLGYRPKSSHLIPNGFDVDRFKPDPRLRHQMREKHQLGPDQLVIGIVARFDPMKDYENFIKAAAIVKNSIPTLRLVMCGKGMDWDNQALVNMIDQSGLKANVLLLGLQSEVQKVMNMLDIAVNSSAFGEGFPNVVCEAMACGVPCVVTDVGDSAMIVGDTGEVVPPKAFKALANALIGLWALPQAEWQLLKQRARARIVENFTIEKIAAEYKRIYDNQRNLQA